MNGKKKLTRAILIAFVAETLSVTWLLKIPGWAPFFSILLLLSGVAIALLLLFFPALSLPPHGKKAWKDPINHHRLVITGLIALVLYSWSRYWFEEMPIDIANADMLPIIKVMGERFLAGQHSHVYDRIPWIWNGIQPIYLPAMWLPYVPAIALHIDMRWVTVAGLLFAFGAFLFLYRPRSSRYGSFFLGVIAFLLFWWLVADNTPGIVSVAEEGTVIAYYVLLVLALVSGKPWLTGIAISLCMLSRYALVGWIPAYLIYMVLEKKWRQLAIISLTGILCFVLLFLVPVGWNTFLRLARLPGDYVPFAARVWNDSPEVFSTAPGLAGFFGPGRIAVLHDWLIGLSFGLPLPFVIFCQQYRRRRQPRAHVALTLTSPHPTPTYVAAIANIPLAGLKLSLVIFYCFIDVPYLYLFYTSSFVSLIMLVLLIRDRQDTANPQPITATPAASPQPTGPAAA